MQEFGVRKQQVSPIMSQSFKPGAWLTNIDFIKRLINMNHLLIVVMSEAQGGKSTFVDLMRFKFEQTIRTVLFQVDKENADALLLDNLATLFDVSFETSSPSFDAFFKALPEFKQPLLLVLDDAHFLSEHCLQQLTSAYKEHCGEKHIHLCLVSDFSLSPVLRRLEQSTFKHFIHTIEPGPLSQSEAKTYVLRYAQGHKTRIGLLNPDKFKAFYAATQGQIAAIHRQIKILNELSATSKKDKVLWKLIPSLVVSLAMFIGVALNIKPSILLSYVIKQPTQAVPLMNESLASYVVPWHTGVEIQPIEPPPLQKFAEAGVQNEEPVDEKLALVDKVVVIPDLSHTVPLEKKQAKTAVPQVKQKPAFTIQLLAAKNTRELYDFMRQHHLSKENVQVQQVSYQQNKWYVLTLGGYSHLVEAQLAAKHLPQSLKQLGPWVRSEAQLEAVG